MRWPYVVDGMIQSNSKNYYNLHTIPELSNTTESVTLTVSAGGGYSLLHCGVLVQSFLCG